MRTEGVLDRGRFLLGKTIERIQVRQPARAEFLDNDDDVDDDDDC